MPAPSLPKSRGASRKRKRQQNADLTVPLLPPELNEDDIEISDEDIEFVQKNKHYAGFLAGMDTKGITKHVLGLKPDWKGDNLEKFYEKRNKASAVKDSRDLVTVDPADVLPVKTLDGKLQYLRHEKQAQIEPPGENKVSTAPKSKPEKELLDVRQSKTKQKPQRSEQSPDVKPTRRSKALEELKTFVSIEEKRSETKARIAELATGLLSSSEESLAPLKELLDICADKDDTISQLAMLSLMAVFKDIIPGYRIRPPTEKELDMQVSKDVKKIRDYESSLLRYYQGYVQKLVKASKLPSFQHLALRCMCGLIGAVPHFNYRESLLGAVIPFMNAADIQCRNLACAALRSMFKNEGKHGGEATVEAVQLIADFVKENNCHLHPDILRVFLSLSFDDDIGRSSDVSSKRGKGERDETYQSFKSKREEKNAKRNALANDLRKEVEEDFREASNIPDVTELRKLQTMTLSAVFETYFRVLKTALTPSNSTSSGSSQSSHPLLGVGLEGLLKFSHLISMEFLGDLLAALRKLAEGKLGTATVGGNSSAGLTVEERLQCCVAAFKIMKINMDALTVDLREFHVQFYNILLQLCPDRDQENEKMFANALQVILCDCRQQDMQRVAAFMKRLAAVSLHCGSGIAVSALVTIRHLLVRYKQCRNLLENDGGNMTVFHPDGSDPDLSGALASVLWELSLLDKHYNPEVAKLSRQISSMMSSENMSVSIMSPTDAIAAYSTQEGGFRPAVKPPSKLVRRKCYKAAPKLDLEPVDSAEASQVVDFGIYFRLLRDFRDNQVLRKELMRTKSMLQMYKNYKATKSRDIKKRR